MKNIEQNLNRHLHENIKLYILSIVCIFSGMIIGVYCIKFMKQPDKNGIYTYLNGFVNNLNYFNIDSKFIFVQALKNNLPFIVAIWFLGMTIIGLPLILIINIFKGFTLGFTISSMINLLGNKGIWISLLGVVPQNIIYIPCIIFLSVIAMNFSITLIKNRVNKLWTTNILQRIASYSIIFVIIFIITLIGYFIESFLAANIIKLII